MRVGSARSGDLVEQELERAFGHFPDWLDDRGQADEQGTAARQSIAADHGHILGNAQPQGQCMFHDANGDLVGAADDGPRRGGRAE